MCPQIPLCFSLLSLSLSFPAALQKVFLQHGLKKKGSSLTGWLHKESIGGDLCHLLREEGTGCNQGLNYNITYHTFTESYTVALKQSQLNSGTVRL